MKVAIMGAGICGLFLAWKLAERGDDVIVFEKKDKIGKEACSGLFSDRILNFIPASLDLVKNQIDYVTINFPKKTSKVFFKRKFFVMDHYRLDILTAKLAQKAGVKIVLRSNVGVSSGLDLSTFDRIIGCDGALSESRRNLKIKDPEFYLGIQGRVYKRDFSDHVETWATKRGFIWKIPTGSETEWGIIESPQEARVIFDNFLQKNNINLETTRAWLIPQGFRASYNTKIALCGDAAGLTKPWSGGGVVWGLKSCDILLRSFPDFAKYRQEARKFFFPQIFFGKMVKKAVYFLGNIFPAALSSEYKIDGDFLTNAR